MGKESDEMRETAPSVRTAFTAGLGQSLAGGRYHLERLLGEGGQKLVYLGRDSRLEREVVIALLKTEKLDPKSVGRLWREAKTLAKLGSHPNIVTVFDVGEEEGRPYIVSEYVQGGTVEDLLKNANQRPLPLEQAVLLTQQVSQALLHAHSRGIVHRDLKPSNVLLSESGLAKLGDFGLAVGLNAPKITLEGEMVGTVAYMSPEQALGIQTEPRSDLYSLGAMLYEMVTGHPPFLGDNLLGILTQHIDTPPVAPSLVNPAVPPALEDLILRLLAKAPEDRLDSAAVLKELSTITAAREAPAQATEDDRSLARLAGGVFVGRNQELRQLRAALHDAISGKGRLLLLVGEAGSGKTRLAEQLSTYAKINGAQVLIGRCYEEQGVPAFWPWVQMVRAYIRGKRASLLNSVMGSGAADIAQFVSEVRERLPDLPVPPSLEPGQARFRLFDSMTSFLKNAAKSRALVLILDDLHWSDAPSLMLLQFLVREMQEARLLVVGTYRDTELGPHHPLAQTLAEIVRHSLTRRISVMGLAEGQVARFIELTAGVSPSRTLVDAVYRGTEGNPFFVNEVVKLLVEEGRLKQRWSGESSVRIPLPQGVREVIGRRLDHLSGACNRVLTVASVIGREFDVHTLEALCDVSSDELVELLDEAVAAKVINETASVGQYSFAHTLIRETLYHEIGAPRRVRLHRRIGEVLENLYRQRPETHLAELAYHFVQAAGAGDLDKAIGYSVRAGERANALLAYEESAGHYEDALNALALKEGPSEHCRCDLLIGLADAQTKAGNIAKGWETFQDAANIARKLAAPEQFARSALGSGSWAMGVRYGTVDQVQIELLEEALTMLAEPQSPLRAKLLAQLALACYHMPGERRLQLSQTALEMARHTGNPDAQLAALFSRTIALEGYEKAGERLGVAAEIVSIAERLGNKEMALRGHFRRLRELLEFGDLASVDHEIEIYSHLADELRQPVYLWLKPFFKSSRALLEGRFEDCESLLEESLKIGQRAQDQNAMLFYATNMTTLRRLQGRFEELTPKVKSFVESYPSIAGWRATLAQIYTELDQRDNARAEFETLAVRDFADLPRDGAWVVSTCLLAQVCAYLKDSCRAAALYEILLPFAGRNIVIGSAAAFYGPVSRHLGLLATTMLRWDEASGHFEGSLASCQRMGARPFEAYTQHEYGAMLLARGREEDRARAKQMFNRARATARELGMAKLIADIQSLTRSAPSEFQS
jgi:tetratricopeptide (TPR) repeat protein